MFTPSEVFQHVCSHQTLPRSPLCHPCLPPRQDLPNRLSLLVRGLCLPETNHTNSRSPLQKGFCAGASLSRARWCAGRSGAGGRAALQAALGSAQRRSNVQGWWMRTTSDTSTGEWTTQEGKETKATRETGSKQECPPLNSHQDPPQSSQLASFLNQRAPRGLLRALVVGRGRD